MLQPYCVLYSVLASSGHPEIRWSTACFLKLPTDSAHGVGAIFQDLVSIVIGLNAQILGSNNETFFHCYLLKFKN